MSLRKLKIKYNARVTGYQEVTLSNNKVILDIESFRIVKAFIKNKEVYYSLNIKVLENPNLINIIVDEDDYDSLRRICLIS